MYNDDDEELDYDPEENIERTVSDQTGGTIDVTYRNNGHSVYHHGGPCGGDVEYDENGEEC